MVKTVTLLKERLNKIKVCPDKSCDDDGSHQKGANAIYAVTYIDHICI